jgi:hypothetical protein
MLHRAVLSFILQHSLGHWGRRMKSIRIAIVTVVNDDDAESSADTSRTAIVQVSMSEHVFRRIPLVS